MYENKARLLCTAEAGPIDLFENIVTVAEAQKVSPRSSRSQKSDDPDLCVDNELGFAKDRTISRYWKCVFANVYRFQIGALPAMSNHNSQFTINPLSSYLTDAFCYALCFYRLAEINSREYLEDFEMRLWQQQQLPLQGLDNGDVVLA